MPSTRRDWAASRLAADRAWPRSRGAGQVVAIVDSGVNGNLPQLKGRVLPGRNMSDGHGAGDIDCLGTGTSMAALVVAHETPGSELTGVAPDASVLPIRVSTEGATVGPAVQAEAIAHAVTAGASVIALGASVNTAAPEVAAAVKLAVERNAVVILGAPNGKAGLPPAGPGVVRMGGVSADMRVADSYREGSVDAVAPGVNVTSLGVAGDDGRAGPGSYLAVAFAAGEAALIRAADPALTAAEVTQRMRVTADRIGDGSPPDRTFGWGMINPGRAVAQVKPGAGTPATENGGTATAEASRSGRHPVLVTVVIAVALTAAGYLGLRLRRRWRADDTYGTRDRRSADRKPVSTVRAPVSAARHWAESTTGPTGDVPKNTDTSHWTDGVPGGVE
ncbi:S8 family serine peptidase [Micromonospora sp. NPDC050397]|uniref:S8 family serine peptidase n=1 Tax=Micromonospora sp. NPDC050397 TaxID=3364279 RepID=UPI00384F3B76